MAGSQRGEGAASSLKPQAAHDAHKDPESVLSREQSSDSDTEKVAGRKRTCSGAVADEKSAHAIRTQHGGEEVLLLPHHQPGRDGAEPVRGGKGKGKASPGHGRAVDTFSGVVLNSGEVVHLNSRYRAQLGLVRTSSTGSGEDGGPAWVPRSVTGVPTRVSSPGEGACAIERMDSGKSEAEAMGEAMRRSLTGPTDKAVQFEAGEDVDARPLRHSQVAASCVTAGGARHCQGVPRTDSGGIQPPVTCVAITLSGSQERKRRRAGTAHRDGTRGAEGEGAGHEDGLLSGEDVPLTMSCMSLSRSRSSGRSTAGPQESLSAAPAASAIPAAVSAAGTKPEADGEVPEESAAASHLHGAPHFGLLEGGSHVASLGGQEKQRPSTSSGMFGRRAAEGLQLNSRSGAEGGRSARGRARTGRVSPPTTPASSRGTASPGERESNVEGEERGPPAPERGDLVDGARDRRKLHMGMREQRVQFSKVVSLAQQGQGKRAKMPSKAGAGGGWWLGERKSKGMQGIYIQDEKGEFSSVAIFIKETVPAQGARAAAAPAGTPRSAEHRPRPPAEGRDGGVHERVAQVAERGHASTEGVESKVAQELVKMDAPAASDAGTVAIPGGKWGSESREVSVQGSGQREGQGDGVAATPPGVDQGRRPWRSESRGRVRLDGGKVRKGEAEGVAQVERSMEGQTQRQTQAETPNAHRRGITATGVREQPKAQDPEKRPRTRDSSAGGQGQGHGHGHSSIFRVVSMGKWQDVPGTGGNAASRKPTVVGRREKVREGVLDSLARENRSRSKSSTGELVESLSSELAASASREDDHKMSAAVQAFGGITPPRAAEVSRDSPGLSAGEAEGASLAGDARPRMSSSDPPCASDLRDVKDAPGGLELLQDRGIAPLLSPLLGHGGGDSALLPRSTSFRGGEDKGAPGEGLKGRGRERERERAASRGRQRLQGSGSRSMTVTSSAELNALTLASPTRGSSHSRSTFLRGSSLVDRGHARENGEPSPVLGPTPKRKTPWAATSFKEHSPPGAEAQTPKSTKAPREAARGRPGDSKKEKAWLGPRGGPANRVKVTRKGGEHNAPGAAGDGEEKRSDSPVTVDRCPEVASFLASVELHILGPEEQPSAEEQLEREQLLPLSGPLMPHSGLTLSGPLMPNSGPTLSGPLMPHSGPIIPDPAYDVMSRNKSLQAGQDQGLAAMGKSGSRKGLQGSLMWTGAGPGTLRPMTTGSRGERKPLGSFTMPTSQERELERERERERARGKERAAEEGPATGVMKSVKGVLNDAGRRYFLETHATAMGFPSSKSLSLVPGDSNHGKNGSGSQGQTEPKRNAGHHSSRVKGKPLSPFVLSHRKASQGPAEKDTTAGVAVRRQPQGAHVQKGPQLSRKMSLPAQGGVHGPSSVAGPAVDHRQGLAGCILVEDVHN